MPNNVKNIVKLSNVDKTKITKLTHTIQNNNKLFQFLHPMPNELINTQSPDPIESKGKGKEVYKIINNCDSEYDTTKINNATLKQQKNLKEKYGYSNWFDWREANWGTKWDAYDLATICINNENSDTSILIYFETAYYPPIDLYEHLKKDGWDIIAVYECDDEMNFSGVWNNDDSGNFVKYNYTNNFKIAAVDGNYNGGNLNDILKKCYQTYKDDKMRQKH